ncbi:hypothetical protein BDV37DRAFT_74132 [Aspergillus pseudonomiae]|uniref:Uncharacterized protein n=1 Tax=Aspergillus pseudonomiae TaxID=1506151 RepID=A0A5N7DI10_9EURO|nr:uncharacterized protein BDV37DRAFT_74132 [Aspergillus pseudonomiae]KAE8406096.1 hypothetical protein BDV37DRAFT_74132 [Aspergillus pseudonomiae]
MIQLWTDIISRVLRLQVDSTPCIDAQPFPREHRDESRVKGILLVRCHPIPRLSDCPHSLVLDASGDSIARLSGGVFPPCDIPLRTRGSQNDTFRYHRGAGCHGDMPLPRWVQWRSVLLRQCAAMQLSDGQHTNCFARLCLDIARSESRLRSFFLSLFSINTYALVANGLFVASKRASNDRDSSVISTRFGSLVLAVSPLSPPCMESKYTHRRITTAYSCRSI